MDDVELSIEGEMAFLHLRRPDAGNALRGVTFDAFRKVVMRLQDTPPRYVILTGDGADFCVGLEPDPKEPLFGLFEPLTRSKDAHRAAEIVTRLRSSLDVLTRLPCPVIAAIEGRCWGAGLALSLLADLRVASVDSTFRVGESHLGVLEGLGGLTRMSALVGPARVTELALTRRELTTAELVGLGVIARSVPAGSALSAAVELAQELRRTGTAVRQQTLLLMRQHVARVEKELGGLETEAAARTWVSGEFLTAAATRS